jgi:hypothetical protein
MSLDHPRAEDALVACGYALARDLPSFYAVKSRDQLPWFLREADQTYPGLVEVGLGLENSRTSLAKLKQGDRPHGTPTAPRDLARPAPETVDCFLGCLMSGLSEEQYREAQGHLRAIQAALKEPSVFCEGLNYSDADFGSPRESLATDLAALRKARHCVFYAYDSEPRPSGMWVEVGAALAWGKPCLLLVADRQAMPPGLSSQPNLRIHQFGTHAKLLEGLADPRFLR